MFWTTQDPSSGSFVQYLTKMIKMVLSCPLTWTQSVLLQHILTRCACVFFTVQKGRNTDYVHVKGHDRTIFVILVKHCTKLPDDGSSVIRNMSENFLHIFIILIVATNIYWCISWIIKCVNVLNCFQLGNAERWIYRLLLM